MEPAEAHRRLDLSNLPERQHNQSDPGRIDEFTTRQIDDDLGAVRDRLVQRLLQRRGGSQIHLTLNRDHGDPLQALGLDAEWSRAQVLTGLRSMTSSAKLCFSPVSRAPQHPRRGGTLAPGGLVYTIEGI
jgi:hypothetical protein